MDNASSDKIMARRIHFVATLVLLLVFSCGMFILNAAGDIANNVHQKDTKQLIQNELSQQLAIVARDQSQISNWDATLRAFENEIDMGFVQDEIADWLWIDFGIQSTIVIDENSNPQVTVFEDKILLPEEGRKLLDKNVDLIEKAKELYFSNRQPVDGGYNFPNNPVRAGSIAYAADFRIVEGKLNIVVAQAMVPSEGYILPEGNPKLLLVAKPVTDSDLEDIKQKLDLNRLTILQNTNNAAINGLSVQFGTSNYWITAELDKPSFEIWKKSIPYIIFIGLLIIGSLFFISIRYSNILAELQKSEEENRFLALHDSLTGLPNRVQFDKALAEVANNKSCSDHAILCIDLDRFKAVNDTYGHHAGDTVLTTVASRINNCLGEKGIVARMGGDEFIILLNNATNLEATIELAEDIIFSVSEDITFEGGIADIGASIGIARWPESTVPAHLVIQSADKALYKAKQQGRGRVCIAEEICETEYSIIANAA